MAHHEKTEEDDGAPRPARPAAPEPAISLPRLRAELEAMSLIGRDDETGGVNRPSFSDADMEARRSLTARMAELGLDSHMDGAGNVIGRWEAGKGPAILLGSHLDSVPMGGMFDGTLGVLAALECVRTLKETGFSPRCPVEIVATSEEEGRFGGMFGVQALCGSLTAEWLEAARDDEGNALTACMRRQGLDPAAALTAARDPSTVAAFLELHIEQGPVLEMEGKTIGIVEGISGVFNWSVRLSGKANHAGTTPMDMRRDAFMGLADFAHQIPGILDREGSAISRLTIGKAEIRPGFPHTVPGEVEFSIVGRDLDEGIMENLAAACRAALSAAANRHDLAIDMQEVSWLQPKYCHPEIIAAFRDQAERMGLEWMAMPSGAGHDTQVMTELTKAGMIFVPSVGGISHSPEELTHWDDIEAGANLLLHTLIALAERPR